MDRLPFFIAAFHAASGQRKSKIHAGPQGHRGTEKINEKNAPGQERLDPGSE